ncbi:MAG: acetate/propionate family kinase [Alphaproteobacteria bacterium]|nr:acetate/propionate family kinase [Alphaproteobacteria bacterium]
MIILVANLGSTSFKYKLFDMSTGDHAMLGQGAAERVGAAGGTWSVTAGDRVLDGQADLADHAAAIDLHMAKLDELGVVTADSLYAVAFKAVHGGPIHGAVPVDETVIETMQRFADVAPAHNPPYVAAMKAFAEKLPDVRQVAAFETAFHQTIPDARQTYAVPWEWTRQLGIRRYGFHGASHRYVADRMAEIAPEARRLINCHLGGSSSICAVDHGRSVATSMGLTPQSGLPQSTRVGDLDIYALLKLRSAGIDPDAALQQLSRSAGLLGISGVGADLRDIEAAADEGNERAQLAIEVLIESIRHYIGAYLAVLNGVDAITFTGGIGQNSPLVRAGALERMDYAGIALDGETNDRIEGDAEARIDAPDASVQLWVLPTNEELVVARQAVEVLGEGKRKTKARAKN